VAGGRLVLAIITIVEPNSNDLLYHVLLLCVAFLFQTALEYKFYVEDTSF